MKKLYKRSDLAGFKHIFIFFSFLILLGTLCINSYGSWWFILFYLCYCTLWGGADAIWHECGHGTAFKTRIYNDVFYQIASFMNNFEPVRWRWSHSLHHSYTASIDPHDFDVEGNELIVSISNPPSLGGFTWSQDGKFTYSAPDDVPAPGPEIVTFDYILTDTEDGFISCDSVGTVTIIINYENDCPITEDDSIIVDGSVASSRIIDVLLNDTDPDSQIDTTSVRIISGPTFGDAISNIDGTITYNFDESPIPFDTITYSVSDFEGCEVLGKVYIYIENLRNPRYNLPNYFTPNGDDFNDYFY